MNQLEELDIFIKQIMQKVTIEQTLLIQPILNKIYYMKKNDKNIPLKALDNGYNIYFCPTCKGTLWQIKCESNYCFRCGQKIKWGDN